VFSRRTARSGWIEQWMNAYDTCWHELEGDNRTEFSALVARSGKHGTAGPETEQEESLYSVLGKQEAMGVWGTLKGLGLTLSGVADVAIWAAWKQTGQPLGLILEQYGVKDASKAPALTPYLSKNYDEVAKLMGDAMGVDPSKDQTLFGQSSYEIGEFGGKIVGALTMAGASVGTAGEAVMGGAKVMTVLGAVKGVEDSGGAIAARVTELRKRKPPPGLGEMLTDEVLLLEAASMLANALGAASGAGDAAPALAKAFKGFGLVVDAAQLAPAVAKAWKDYNDPELAKDPEKRDAALRDHAANILGTVLSTIGTKHQEAVEARAEKSMADADAAFQERYNARGEAGDGGGGGSIGGGGDPFDRSGPSDLGGGEVLEPHPGGHQNEPAFIPGDAEHPEAGTGNRDELFDLSGEPIGPGGWDPEAAREAGRRGEEARTQEVGKTPPRWSRVTTRRDRRQIQEDLASGRMTLREIAEAMGESGTEQFYIRVRGWRNGRYVDHVFVEGDHVVMRESKNYRDSEFTVTEQLNTQLAKDSQLLASHPELIVEWRITGPIDETSWATLDAMRERTGGRFRFTADDSARLGAGEGLTQEPTLH
jgi:hypothetical protein